MISRRQRRPGGERYRVSAAQFISCYFSTCSSDRHPRGPLAHGLCYPRTRLRMSHWYLPLFGRPLGTRLPACAAASAPLRARDLPQPLLGLRQHLALFFLHMMLDALPEACIPLPLLNRLPRRGCGHLSQRCGSVVRQLLVGKKLLFVSRGRVTLKGFPERMRVYEVTWQDERE